MRRILVLSIAISTGVVALLPTQAKAVFPGSNGMAPLLHRWSFNDGTAKDDVGTADGTLYGRAAIRNGALFVGRAGYMLTSPLPETITEKTLVSWVGLRTLSQGGGSALTIENASDQVESNYFDAIDFAERTPYQWMAGSESFNRSPLDNGGAPETEVKTVVMIAITYASDNSIKIYRDGIFYAGYTLGTLQTYVGGNTDALVGLRHITCASDCYLGGAIDEARIYGAALSAEQIVDLYEKSLFDPRAGL